jgi:ERO1-like protein alpha
MICNFHTCTVCQCEENEIPLPWKQDSLFDSIDKKIDEKFFRWIEKYNYSSPHWIVENEIDSLNGIFVNLEKNPESFTGYQGQHIWNAIYYENCFSNNARSIKELCREDLILYKIISGLHSNINVHLSYNYMDIDKNISFVNSTMVKERLTYHPDRINNLFFLYSLLIKAFYKAEAEIKNYHYYTGNEKEDNITASILKELYEQSPLNGKEMCEDCLIRELSAEDNFENFDNFLNFNSLKLDELKLKFRNVTQIIDCVSCQKCKLHGKLQIYGLATMLKILFSKDCVGYSGGFSSIVGCGQLSGGNQLNLKRNELISFINLVGKVSRSIHYLYKINNDLSQTSSNEIIKFCGVAFFFSFLLLGMVYLNIHFVKNKEYYENKNRSRARGGVIKKPQNVKKDQNSRKISNNQSSSIDEHHIYDYLNKIKTNEDYVITKKNQ